MERSEIASDQKIWKRFTLNLQVYARSMRILCVFGQHNYGDPARGEGYEFTNFLPALRALGHEVSLFDSWDRTAYFDFADLSRAFLRRVAQEQPDVIFCVLLGYELWSETLDIVRSTGSAVIINWGTDDSWKYEEFARFMAPHIDWYVTTYPDVLRKARRNGMGNFVLSQWAASHNQLAEPLPSQHCKYSVTFVGSAYGNRRKWIERLRARGIRVECFGHGWPSGPVPAVDLPRIYRESVVTLNFGDSALHLNGMLPYRSRQLKARVFEVPGAGGCLLTEHAQNLEQYFRIGEEILVFSGPDELAGHIRYLLAHPDRRDAISRKGFERVRDQHTYDKRFSELLDKVMSPPTSKSVRPIDWVGFESAAVRHSVGSGLRTLKRVLVGPAQIMFGVRRGPRAARRLVFELSWRLAGSRTYSAVGWPGRMFYKES